MAREVGELLVGAYLQLIKDCEMVGYNFHLSDPGLEGMGEIDVIGLNFKEKKAYLCEVATHLEGLNYGGTNEETLKKIRTKLVTAENFAKNLTGLTPEIMFWSPRVPKGALTTGLGNIPGLVSVINDEFARRIRELQEKALETSKEYGNDAFRLMQLLARMQP